MNKLKIVIKGQEYRLENNRFRMAKTFKELTGKDFMKFNPNDDFDLLPEYVYSMVHAGQKSDEHNGKTVDYWVKLDDIIDGVDLSQIIDELFKASETEEGPKK